MDLSVIIVNFNTSKLTLQCIKSVMESDLKLNYELIVIDNGSSDGSVQAIKKLKRAKTNSPLTLVENATNMGFAYANNQGIKRAQGKYILLLNSDTKVKKDAIAKLITFAAKTPDAGAVGARLLNPDGTIQPSAFNQPTLGRTLLQYWFGRKNLLDKFVPKTNGYSKVESLVMAAFLITPVALTRVGLLDDKYFMYFEDHDYCRRLAQDGLAIYYLATSEVFHYHGASGRKLARHQDQWRRLVPSSKIYHGLIGHYLIFFVMWSGQKVHAFFNK